MGTFTSAPRDYYKLVALNRGKEEWMLDEFREGRLRFGWSWPDCDLDAFPRQDRPEWSSRQKISWRYTQFLTQRIRQGDRVIVQHRSPLREFLIGEVTGPYSFADPAGSDFNHILPVRPITANYVSITSRIIPAHLRHGLTKRGQYYKLYDLQDISRLEVIIANELWNDDDHDVNRSFQDELIDARENVVVAVKESIRHVWRSKDFETFIANLLELIPNVEVVSAGDSGKGWDLTLALSDPISLEQTESPIPVQCKAYTGSVTTLHPVEDMIRAIENTKSPVGYLIMLGELSEVLKAAITDAETHLSETLKRPVEIRVIDEDTIAELAIRHGFFSLHS